MNKSKARREAKAYARALRRIERAVAAEKRPAYRRVVHPSQLADVKGKAT